LPLMPAQTRSFTPPTRDHSHSTRAKTLDRGGGDKVLYGSRCEQSHGVTREWLRGRASPCQGEGRGFESRLPLQRASPNVVTLFCLGACTMRTLRRISVARDTLSDGVRRGGLRRAGNREGRLSRGGLRGKSELHRAGCWLTASGGDPQDSATETNRRCGAQASER
jgi:hypothetical protein